MSRPDEVVIELTTAEVVIDLAALPVDSAGVTQHAQLSGLAWTASGHTGAALGMAGWDADGAPLVVSSTAFGRELLNVAGDSAARGLLGAELVGSAEAAVDVHEEAADPHPQYATAAEVVAYAQPLSADLTVISALTGTGLLARTGPGAAALVGYGTTPAAGAIPQADGAGLLGAAWLPGATEAAAGAVRLAASGGTTAGQAVQASDARLGDATRTQGGLSRQPQQRAAVWRVAQQPIPAASGITTLVVVAGRLYALRFSEAGLYDQIAADVTTASGAGTRLRIGVYSEGATGEPDALIWDSGHLTSDSIAPKSLSFSAGTWADTSYQEGANLLIRQGQRVYCALFVEAAPTVRAISYATTETLGWASTPPAASTTHTSHLRATTPPAYGALPSSFGAVTATANSASPALSMRGA